MALRGLRILFRLSLYFALIALSATASAIGKDRGLNSPLVHDRTEALLQQFIEWQRAKRH